MNSSTTFEGLLLVNKPPGPTSHDVVQIVRRTFGISRIGHTGTLDPMAQGLLILLVGCATRHQQTFQAHPKVYEAVLRLGTQTDTGDATGAPVRTVPVPGLSREHVAKLVTSFQGPLSQTPPAYSAIKVRGRPAYWWTRRRQPVTLSTRIVHLSEMRLIDCDVQTITFRVSCSAGTYIRTLAELIAERLGTVGHLTKLIRLQVGHWRIEEAIPLSWITQATPEALAQNLLPATPKHATVHEVHPRPRWT